MVTDNEYDPETALGRLIEAIQAWAQSYWRKKIAQEIESVMCDKSFHGNTYDDRTHAVAEEAYLHAIRIAKGENNGD